jgi:hypothetical protein
MPAVTIMRRPIKLFVSAARDLDRERDVIGRVVAELPVTAGWTIGRTPVKGQAAALSPALTTAATCDLFIFLLGQDISAPAGSEWDAARAARRPLLALLKDVTRTPAGQEFQRYGQDGWVRFRSAEELERQVRGWLVRQLLDHAEPLRLTLPEIEQLATLHGKLKDELAAPPSPPGDPAAAAGGGGVILATPPGSVRP